MLIGSTVIMPRHFSPTPTFPLEIIRPDNKAAFQTLRTSYPVLPGTTNTLVIDDQTERLSRNPLRLGIFDWDEHVSLIKCGWPIAMRQYLAKLWATPDFVPPHLAYYQDAVVPTDEAFRCAEIYIRGTTGTLTQTQYSGAVDLKSFINPKTGGIDQERLDRTMEVVFDQNEMIFSDPSGHDLWTPARGNELWKLGGEMYDEWHEIMDAEFRLRRLDRLAQGLARPAEYQVEDVIPFIRGIHERNVLLFGLSGSAQFEVEEDAKALKAFKDFKTIFGVGGTLEWLTGRKYSKTAGGDYILESEHITEDQLPQVGVGGDGPSEMAYGRKRNCTRMGLVPAHVEKPIELAETLIKHGAQYLFLGGFTDWRVTVPYFFGKN